MASSRYLIASQTLGSSAASVTFSSIPSTYTDLVLRASIRTTRAAVQSEIYIYLNGDTASNYSYTTLGGTGSAAFSGRVSSSPVQAIGYVSAASATANTFGSVELYIPSYTVSQNKPLGSFGAAETNAAAVYMSADAGLWRSTATINSIQVIPDSNNFDTGSSFYLYGLKSS